MVGLTYPVHLIHRETLMKEVLRLEKLGVLKLEPDSQYASLTFIMPKPNGTVQFLTDFHRINQCIMRTKWPISKISTILQELQGFNWATLVDLNMGYYTIRTDPDSQEMCALILA